MVGTTFGDWCGYFQYEEGTKREDQEKNRADARSALLVVATLIAAVTFQAGVNPPGGVWQETKEDSAGAASPPVAVGQDFKVRHAGTAICASESSAYYVFLTFNTLAFSAAVLVIMSLTHKFPFKFEVRVACLSMIITYGSAICAVTPDTTTFRLALITAAVPLILRCLIQLLVKFENKDKNKNKNKDKIGGDQKDQTQGEQA